MKITSRVSLNLKVQLQKTVRHLKMAIPVPIDFNIQDSIAICQGVICVLKI